MSVRKDDNRGIEYTSVLGRLRASAPIAVPVVFFGALFLMGYALVGDYGVSWDEPAMVRLGEAALQTFTQAVPWTDDVGIRFHGPFIEFFLQVATRLFVGSSGTTSQMYLLRHLLTFWIFVGGLICFYRICIHLFRSIPLAILGCLFIVLHPTLFSHAFYNSRDIPTMAVFTASMYTLLLLLEKPNTRRVLLHAAVIAALLAIRISAIYAAVITVIMLVLTLVPKRYMGTGRDLRIISLVVFCVALPLLSLLFWPLLWQDPVHNFAEAYAHMSAGFTSGVTFYFGPALEGLPWHYLFGWIGITTPPFFTVLMLLGFSMSLWTFARKPMEFLLNVHGPVFALAWFFVPVSSVVLLHAPIFDGWRHFFFVYPALVLLMLTAWKTIWDSLTRLRIVQWLWIAATLVALGWTAAWMVRNHPLQNMYFSIPAEQVQGQFELDYWGLSYIVGMREILRREPSPVIPIYPVSSPGWSTRFILTPDEQRLKFTNEASAAYILDNFRNSGYKHTYPDSAKVHSIMVDDIEVLAIYQKEPGTMLPKQ